MKKRMRREKKQVFSEAEKEKYFDDNARYAKNTEKFYFKTINKIDYTIFKPKKFNGKDPSFFGGKGCKDLFCLLGATAFEVGSNKIALHRHFAYGSFGWQERTLRLNIQILEELGFIRVVKNKDQYLYIYLNDYRELKGWGDRDEFGRVHKITALFVAVATSFKSVFNQFKSKTFTISGSRAGNTENKTFKLKAMNKHRMNYFNDVILEFYPIDNPQATYSYSYKQITGKKVPHIMNSHFKSIIKKNVIEALSKGHLEINTDFLEPEESAA